MPGLSGYSQLLAGTVLSQLLCISLRLNLPYFVVSCCFIFLHVRTLALGVCNEHRGVQIPTTCSLHRVVAKSAVLHSTSLGGNGLLVRYHHFA